MSTAQNELATVQTQQPKSMSAFSSIESFENVQRMAGLLAQSDMVPTHYRKNVPNCVIAMELANRIGASVFAVMQNLAVINGKPSWEAKFIISALNTSGLFSPLRYHIEGQDMTLSCYAWAVELATGERLEGPVVTMQMAKDEGWLTKNGSKWKTMPDLMIRYRAASFFGKLYAPEILTGMQTSDELRDVVDVEGERIPEPKTKDIDPANEPDSETKPIEGEIEPKSSTKQKDPTITAGHLKLITGKMKQFNVSEMSVLQEFDLNSLEEVTRAQMPKILEWIGKQNDNA